MNRLFCDECEKEIIDENYVVQSIFIHYQPIEQSSEGIYCKECWTKFEEEAKR